MIICVDMVTTFDIMDSVAKFSGGLNYTVGVLNYLRESEKNLYIRIIIPNAIEEKNNGLLDGLEKLADDLVPCEGIEKYNYVGCDTLYLPQVNGHVIMKLKKIHKINPKMKIYGTLHDRQHNLFKYDSYDTYYKKNLLIHKVLDPLVFMVKKRAFDLTYNINVRYFDKIFTVSNYSAQMLEHKNAKEIIVFRQENTLRNNAKSKDIKEINMDRGEYMLFVSGERPEKNLLRTLEAYCNYYKKSKKKVQIKITGINKDLMERLLRSGKLEKEIIKEKVEFYEYINRDELSDLYKNSRYVLFMSKGEGYGLPIIEALSFGKAILASRVTSIPEVAGAAVKYINPYDKESMSTGMLYYDNDEMVKKYEQYGRQRYKVLNELSNLDSNIMVSELME